MRSLLPCSMCVHENILAVGGLEGDLLCVDLLSKGEVFRGKICDSDSAITNSLSVTGTRGSGEMQLQFLGPFLVESCARMQ